MGSSWKQLANWIREIQENPLERRRLCPRCEYPIDATKSGGLHCDMCGWADSLSLKRDSEVYR